MRYPYLDAARIAAAASVYAFHVGMPGASWGFIGVDFFMVLSGFVVTVSVLAKPDVSAVAFLQARMSRLVPGMLVFLLVATAALLLLVGYNERVSVLGYLFPSALYYSNWYSIFVADDYFNQNNVNLFIHIWSLAVEEQFYAAFAILLLLPIRTRFPLKIVALVTLGIYLWFARSSMTDDRFYFGTESRAVQFLIGSLIAHKREWLADLLRRVPLLTIVVLAGALAGIAVSLSAGHSGYFYRGYALTTAASAAFILVAIKRAPVAAPTHPLVSRFGHASYTAYLLHMPLVLALGVLTPMDLGWQLAGLAILLLVSLFVSLAIEVPAQRILRRLRPLAVVIGAPLALLGTAWAAHSAIVASIPPGILTTDLTSGYFLCRDDLERGCYRTGEPGMPVILLLADSVGSSILDAPLANYAEENGLAYVSAAMPNCAIRARLTVGFNGKSHLAYEECFEYLPKRIAAELAAGHLVQVVISSGTEGYPMIVDGKMLVPEDPRWEAEALAGAQELLAPVAAAGVRIVVAIPPQRTATLECFTDQSPCFMPRYPPGRVGDLDRALAVSLPNAIAVDLNDAVCSAGQCPLVIDSKITRYDGLHFTRDAADMLTPRVVSTLGLE